MALEKQGMGEVALDEDQVGAVRFVDPIANLISLNFDQAIVR